MSTCGTCMPWSVKVVASRARTLILSAVKPNRFWFSTCSGVSLIQVTVASATRDLGGGGGLRGRGPGEQSRAQEQKREDQTPGLASHGNAYWRTKVKSVSS